MTRVIICGTYPTQFNGYSKVLFELVRGLASYKDMEVFVFGFQNYYVNQLHNKERELPPNVEVYDAFKNENPRKKGFGEDLIEDYVKEKKPDVVIVYNDLIVLSAFLERLHKIENRTFKIIPYIDLVYKNERNALVMNIEEKCDAGIMFTKHWQDVIKGQGFQKPTYVLEHGFNAFQYYPIPKNVARTYFNLPEDSFIVANLNRNQPRKRWDICMMAFVKFISRHLGKKIKLVIATAMNGAWDLIDVFVHECRKYKLDPEVAKQHLIMVQNPQMLTDREINIMYNASDIGINTCDGEGFGLCNFEQAGLGVPQIVPHVGGFLDFFTKENAMCVDPKWSYYVDSTRDVVGGEAEMCSIDDYVDALEAYYANPALREQHGKTARANILKNYTWAVMCEKLYKIIKENSPQPPSAVTRAGLTSIQESPEEEETNTNVDVSLLAQKPTLVKATPVPATPVSTGSEKNKKVFKDMKVIDNTLVTPAPAVSETEPVGEVKTEPVGEVKTEPVGEEEEEEEMSVEEIKALQKKLNQLMKKKNKSMA